MAKSNGFQPFAKGTYGFSRVFRHVTLPSGPPNVEKVTIINTKYENSDNIYATSAIQ